MAEPKGFSELTRRFYESKEPRNSGLKTVLFPSHLYKLPSKEGHWPFKDSVSSWLMKSFIVKAAETNFSNKDAPSHTTSTHETQAAPESSLLTPTFSPELEMLAQAYIEHETGTERVKMIFKKDHMGKSSPEMEYIQVVLFQTFVISFFIKYVPEFRFARQDFIREHHGTVFRTRLEAVRRMQDHISLRAATAGGRFAVKMTLFATSFA
ncbi:RPII140-upstream gene protein [Elysia marginata]|uniref:Complex I assembly factor TIMMDC1, mitochondrial n=1 Tax=Elysia marginata TaxID=1093978 RepID=A0AAV4EN00_9GAST|nr:RPII140-upstream gene protein [Elysia marginata]